MNKLQTGYHPTTQHIGVMFNIILSSQEQSKSIASSEETTAYKHEAT